MKNTHQHWKALKLQIPVGGAEDPWIAGRKYFQITADISRALAGSGGLSGGEAGDRKNRAGHLEMLYLHYFYDDLAAAVEAFRAQWTSIRFPDRTRLTHIERFPDCSFVHHVMIRWIDGRMDPYSTNLTDAVRLNPTNG